MNRALRRDGHPLGVRRELIDEPEEVTAEAEAPSRKWTFGVAAGALIVAGTFAAGALGINSGSVPFAGSAPEHAPAAPGNGPIEVGPPPGQVAPPPVNGGGREDGVDPQATQPASATPGGPSAPGPQAPAPAPGDNGGGTGGGGNGGGGAPAPAPTPPPAPAPAPPPQQPAPGPVEQVLTPVTDTVGGVLSPVTGAVGGILSPVTNAVSSGGDQPALTMIDPLGDLLGG